MLLKVGVDSTHNHQDRFLCSDCPGSLLKHSSSFLIQENVKQITGFSGAHTCGLVIFQNAFNTLNASEKNECVFEAAVLFEIETTRVKNFIGA